MHLTVMNAFILEIFELTLYIGCGYLAFGACARYSQNSWLRVLAGKRLAVLTLLTLLVIGIKVFEDVIAKESGPIDTAVLWLIRQNTPPAVLGIFSLVTWSGAAVFLVPATVVTFAWLMVARYRHEAFLLAASMASAWALTYTLKALIGRARPELWSTTWYWGTSFPSGHTLSTATFATALALGATRIWPQSRNVAFPLAALWTALVGLSRLALGVHWPTDVLAAICLGVFIPLAISVHLDVHQHRQPAN